MTNSTAEGSPRLALASLSLCMLLSSFGTSSANVALPAMAHGFSASLPEVQWVVLAYLIAITTLVVSAGRLGDVAGRRRLMLVGLFLFTTASAACAAAPTLGWLVAARAAQGFGAAAMMALTMALVGESVPKSRTGSAMGLLGAMSAVGTALGPSLGGLLLAESGWRAIFAVNLPLGAATLLLVSRYLPADRGGPRAAVRFDMAGTLVLGLALAAYAFAMTAGGGSMGPLNAVLLASAGVGAWLFLRIESAVAAPLVNMALLRIPVVRSGVAMNVLATTVVMATFVAGPFYLSGALALEPAAVGAVMATGPVVAALTGVPAGWLVDRFGTQHAMAAGLAAMAAGSLMLALGAGAGVSGYAVPLAVLTAGYALFQASNNTAVMAVAEQAQRGVVSGLLNLSRNLGLITGASAMAAVYAFAAGRGAHHAQGLRATFAIALLLVGAALTLHQRAALSSRASAC